MRLALLVLLAPAVALAEDSAIPMGSAHAQGDELEIAPDAACNLADHGLLKTRRLVVGGIEAVATYECEGLPTASRLALHTKSGWFTTAGAIHDGSRHSVEPYSFSLEHTTLATGTLDHKVPAVLLQNDLKWQDFDGTTGKVLATKHQTKIMFCSLEDTPRCGTILLECKGACGPASLAGGVLKAAGTRHVVK